jgi:hypothetical protein
MNLYELMANYATSQGIAPTPEILNPELGSSLSLFNTSLIESGMDWEGPEEHPRVNASPKDIDLQKISHFTVAFLPFSSITKTTEINAILFEVFSFLKWLDRRDIVHGLSGTNVMALFKDLSAKQERCLKLSHLLDEESGNVLKLSPDIHETVTDIFSVEKIDSDFVFLKGQDQAEIIRLRLPAHIVSLVEPNDFLDLVLGDTSDRWVLLEAGRVYPYSSDSLQSS